MHVVSVLIHACVYMVVTVWFLCVCIHAHICECMVSLLESLCIHALCVGTYTHMDGVCVDACSCACVHMNV